MRKIIAVIGFVSVAFAGCKAKEAYDKVSIARDLDKKGTMDLMKDVSNDKYTAPADNKLTDAQIQMYLKVREHEKQIAEVARQQAQQHADAAKKAGEKSLAGLMEGMKTIGSAADLATADIRAAKDLGYNTQEYLWVKGQVLAASSAAMAEQATKQMNASMDASYQQMKKAYDEAKDEQTKKMYADMLAGFEKSKQEMQQNNNVDAATAYNRQLLSKYENALNALNAEVEKWNGKPQQQQTQPTPPPQG